MRFPHPGGFGAFSTVFTDILAGLAFIICFVIVVGLLVVLVRFLLVATKAAEIYVARNSGATTSSRSARVPPCQPRPRAPHQHNQRRRVLRRREPARRRRRRTPDRKQPE
jgi:hypothetical protein